MYTNITSQPFLVWVRLFVFRKYLTETTQWRDYLFGFVTSEISVHQPQSVSSGPVVRRGVMAVDHLAEAVHLGQAGSTEEHEGTRDELVSRWPAPSGLLSPARLYLLSEPSNLLTLRLGIAIHTYVGPYLWYPGMHRAHGSQVDHGSFPETLNLNHQLEAKFLTHEPVRNIFYSYQHMS